MINKAIFNSSLRIPNHRVLMKSHNLRVYHGFVPSGRDMHNRNIKGTPIIIEAIEKLRKEGHPIELVNVSDLPSNEVRFIQSQCDVILDQLIYGWWGSTGVEGMSLGKPVICFLRPEWKSAFLKSFPEYKELPIIEATTQNIYDVLLALIRDRDVLVQAAEASEKFSEMHFNLEKNAEEFIETIAAL